LDTRLDVDHRADASFDAVVIDMTKSAQIMELYAQGLSTREIADKVGCRTEYVRVVARQRNGHGASHIDMKYTQSKKGKATLAKRHKNRQQNFRAYYRTLWATADAEECRERRRQVYRAARDRGASAREATIIANTAVRRVVQRTADYEAARKAYASGDTHA
jgi:transposase